jgi:PAS domain S-box-containing protein
MTDSDPEHSTTPAPAACREAWLPFALAAIGDAVIGVDAAGIVTLINEVAEHLTGCAQAAALGRPCTEVLRIADPTREAGEDLLAQALRQPENIGRRNEAVLVASDGTQRLITSSAVARRTEAGVVVGALLFFRDVTGEADASATRARLAAIVESSDDAILSKTLDGVIQSWNAGAERLFGYTSEEAVGQPVTLIIPRERLDEEREILARIARGDRVDHFETVRVAKDGRRIDISLTVSPVRGANGRIVGASKVARDITDRKRAVEALREADLRKDRFIAVLAHELRNPLAPIRSGLHVMRLAAADPATVERARAMMERQLAHMVRLIDDLLDISRINENKMELRRSVVLLSEVISNAVEAARPTIDDAGHEFTATLPAEPIYLDADLTRLAQVFANLLTNSARYTPRGGRIRLVAERHGGDIVVRVHDNGIGIPAAALPTIFEMFSQVDRSQERASGGLGIGLSLVKGLVRMHEGSVSAESAGPGKGATFTVTLPARVEQCALEPGAAVESETLAASTRRRVLVADDNADSAHAMAMLLELIGHEVRIAQDGVEAVDFAERFRPHVIFMDVGMPRLNGYAATQRIREYDWGQAIVIVALTGWGQANDREQSRAAGCDDHLVKPASAASLQRIVEAGRSRGADV